jgi:hypothetical protein
MYISLKLLILLYSKLINFHLPVNNLNSNYILLQYLYEFIIFNYTLNN